MITLQGDRIYIDGEKSNFKIHEFVAPEIYEKWGSLQSLRYVYEPRIRAAQYIRDAANTSVVINDYKYGGTYKDSGSRTVNSYIRMLSRRYEKKGYQGEEVIDKCLQAYLDSDSMHKYYAADDYKIGEKGSYWSSEDMAELVLDHEKDLMDIGIRRMENPQATKGKNRSWLHLDTGNSGTDYILQVNP